MAYEKPFIRFSFGGTTADANEIWSCGLAISFESTIYNDLSAFERVATLLPDLGTIVNNFIGHADVRVPNNVKSKWAKLALIGVDGKYMTDAAEVEIDWGGNVNAPYSPQDALAITLDSGKWKAPGKTNRFYLPTAGPAAANAWKLSPTEQEALVLQAAVFIDDLNTELDTIEPDVFAQVAVVSPVGEGFEMRAIEVRVGAIVDTQRRRRNKLTEDYVAEPLG